MPKSTTRPSHVAALEEGNGGVDIDFDGFDSRTSIIEYGAREEQVDDLVAMFAGRRAPRFSIYS